MKKILVRAPLLTNSGYGIHSRQVLSWLLEKEKEGNIKVDVECLNWGSCPWIIDKSKEDGIISEIMTRSIPLSPPYDITFQVQLPDEWDPSLGKYNVGITAAVETDKCNPEWVDRCNKMNRVIVPSTFTKNVLKRSGTLKTKINVIPEWYHETIDKKDIQALDLDLKTDFNFLTVGLLTGFNPDEDRKNLINTVRLFCKKFKDNKDVGLIIKSSLGRYSSFDRKKSNEYFSKVVEAIRETDFPKVYLLHGALTKEEMASLYLNDKIKCYVSLTRGEGYGLPLVEAAASGLPIIATNYSGHLEFLKKEKFLPVSYEMIKIPNKKIDNRIFVNNAKWAEPNEESYFTRLDSLYYNYETHKSNALDYSLYIKDNYSKSEILKSYNNNFKDIL